MNIFWYFFLFSFAYLAIISDSIMTVIYINLLKISFYELQYSEI